MKTKNLNDLKKSNIVELTKEQQRKIMGGATAIEYAGMITFIGIGSSEPPKKP